MATFVEFISALHSAKQQSIVWHHQVEGPGSYSAHKALNNFYDEILELIDGLVESTQGIYGRLKGYDVHDLADFTSIDDVQSYFKSLYDYVQTERKGLYQESWIQNQIDEVSQLIAETIYLLSLR
jgi:DNA-binding ferritin-like protein